MSDKNLMLPLDLQEAIEQNLVSKLRGNDRSLFNPEHATINYDVLVDLRQEGILRELSLLECLFFSLSRDLNQQHYWENVLTPSEEYKKAWKSFVKNSRELVCISLEFVVAKQYSQLSERRDRVKRYPFSTKELKERLLLLDGYEVAKLTQAYSSSCYRSDE